jgi:hypothetical protein
VQQLIDHLVYGTEYLLSAAHGRDSVTPARDVDDSSDENGMPYR